MLQTLVFGVFGNAITVCKVNCNVLQKSYIQSTLI